MKIKYTKIKQNPENQMGFNPLIPKWIKEEFEGTIIQFVSNPDNSSENMAAAVIVTKDNKLETIPLEDIEILKKEPNLSISKF